ncbi:MAG: hypothetical protein U5R30_10335 [Deltaproteobacteria bacterium]|nr:hypothetical protein [Deltaproteobacteria bacterium]
MVDTMLKKLGYRKTCAQKTILISGTRKTRMKLDSKIPS